MLDLDVDSDGTWERTQQVKHQPVLSDGDSESELVDIEWNDNLRAAPMITYRTLRSTLRTRRIQVGGYRHGDDGAAFVEYCLCVFGRLRKPLRTASAECRVNLYSSYMKSSPCRPCTHLLACLLNVCSVCPCFLRCHGAASSTLHPGPGLAHSGLLCSLVPSIG